MKISSSNTKLLKKEEEIYKNLKLDNTALTILYSSTSIAKESSNYWKKNGGKWKKLTSNLSRKKSGFWQGVWDGFMATTTADVQGGAAGAGFAWAYNVVPGGGQVGYTATIIATAAGNSIMSIFD